MHNIFQSDCNPNKNHLPYDGTLHYWGAVFTTEQSEYYYRQLLSSQILWKNDEAIIFGKHILTKRKGLCLS